MPGQVRGRELVTLGHGRLDRQELADLIRGARLERVIDIRRFPGSRVNDAATRESLTSLLAALGVDYRWDERLGGRRHLRAAQDADSPDGWWRVRAFRAYAGWTRSADFRAGLADLLDDVDAARTAVLCSESVWWRCHRRLVADVATIEHSVAVAHLMPDGRLSPHQPSDGARRDPAGHLVWDKAGEAAPT